MKIISVFGTRPEAIKMAPLVKELEHHPDKFESIVCVTAQHRHMLDPVLELFDIHPKYDLNIMKPDQDLFDITSSVLQGLKSVFKVEKPDFVLVHGDTTTTLAATLAAYYCKIKVGHVEAGLRTGKKYSPFPEEINRKVVGCIADLHFAPTPRAALNLEKEGVNHTAIAVTGNTVIDALLHVTKLVKGQMASDMSQQFAYLDSTKKMILITGHRRENFGAAFENICNALVDIAKTHHDLELVYPVHLNPNVRGPVEQIIRRENLGNIHLIEPVDYAPFVYLMNRSYLVITDSGGVQEEAPFLGKPVLLLRNDTERPEAVSAGGVKMVGTNRKLIVEAVGNLLLNSVLYNEMSTPCYPYGDGTASRRITKELADFLERTNA